MYEGAKFLGIELFMKIKIGQSGCSMMNERFGKSRQIFKFLYPDSPPLLK